MHPSLHRQTTVSLTKTSTQVRHLEKEMGKYKKEARAAKQELQFEQSIPSAPVYEHNEPGHTTPLFGSGGPDCGASRSLLFSLAFAFARAFSIYISPFALALSLSTFALACGGRRRGE